MSKNTEMYEKITNKIVAMLDRGVVPWRKPWNADAEMPRNLVSKKAYRGINVWLLGFSGYSSPFWLTFNQCKNKGGKVKKGEKSTEIYFWQFAKVAKKDEKGKPVLNEKGEKVFNTFPMLKVYRVFNVEQCEGLKVPAIETTPKTENEKISICEGVVNGYENAPSISFGGGKAFYRPSMDAIQMPPMKNFNSSEKYYSTLFHEMTHSTGHEKRLKREGITNISSFGSHRYSKEELVAEFGASFLCAHCGIENITLDNSASYIASWKKSLKNDPAIVMTAAGHAQKATDLILGIKFEHSDEK